MEKFQTNSDCEALIPPFIKNSSSRLNLHSFHLDTTRREDGKIEFHYKLVFDEPNCPTSAELSRFCHSQKASHIIDLIHVTVVLLHYSSMVVFDENERIVLQNLSKNKKARTTFNHEFKSTTTIREVLREFYDDFQSRIEGDFTPVLSYTTGKNNAEKKTISSKMMDKAIGKLARDQENFTIYVNVTKKGSSSME